MPYSRRCLLVLVFLTLSMACYVILYSHVSKSAVTNINSKQLQAEKNYQRFPSIQRKRSESDSIILTNLRRGRSLTNTTYNRFGNDFISNRENRGIPQESAKENLTLSKTHNSKMHLDGFLRNYSINSNPIEEKNTHGTTNINLSLNSIQHKTPCSFVFNQSSLEAARKKLSDSESGVLFFVNIRDNDLFDFFTNQEKEELLHWQYVKKKEKYLEQLPVDFDLVTYFLFTNDNEEFVLNLDVVYNNQTCKENFPEALRSVKSLLWNNLFHNATDFFLCNRYFEDQPLRNWLYWITTIWVGNDLTCSEMLSEDDQLRMNEYIVEKDVLSYVVSFVTFYLSLQFIWIFALLDLNKGPGTSLEYYRKDNRPYGINRFISKLLYMKCPCISESNAEKWRACKRRVSKIFYKVTKVFKPETSEENGSYCIEPVDRLLLLTWGLILVFFGLYRTMGRYFFLNANFFQSYLEVIKPSEPICSLLQSDNVAVTIDFLIATLVPLIFVCMGKNSYETFTTNNSRDYICVCDKCCNETSDDEYIPIDSGTNATQGSEEQETNSKISDMFVQPLCDMYHILYSLVKCECSECPKMIKYLVYCLFPIIHFICNQLTTCKCCGKCCKISCKVICFIATLICLRPIISTFTFIFRSFTYFVFVALLIRIHLMRYSLIIVSILVYILKYVMEINNMNVDILNYIISLEIKPVDSVEKKISEKIFDKVYKELSFVKRRIYFLCLKILIVALYLIITIMLFTQNREFLIGINFKDSIEVLFFIIGPYAVTFVLKTHKGDYLSEENKIEIKDIYDRINLTDETKEEETPV